MSNDSAPDVLQSQPYAGDPDAIWPMLADPVRRRLVFALARGGPQAASQLNVGVSRKVDCTVKHLTAMRDAGILLAQPDPKDKRRQLYRLSPQFRVTATEHDCTIEFVMCNERVVITLVNG